MKRRTLWISLCLVWPLVVVVWLGRMGVTPAAADDKVDAALQEALLSLAPDETARFIVHLTEQATLSEETLPSEKVARRRAVVDELQAVAAASQPPLLSFLKQLETNNNVTNYQPLWIINAVVVEGNAAAVNALSARTEVARMTLDVQHQFLSDPEAIITESIPNAVPWGITQLKAPQTWYGLGITGQGVVVAIMDTGVDWQHPDLAANYRGSQAGTPSHNGHWFDVVDGDPEPIDPHGHGTHVAGTAVGQDSIGVAPGAAWIAVRMLDETGTGYLSQIHQAFQWIMAPAGDPALAPDVVNGSWSIDDPTDTTFWPDVQALESAGILAVFAAGNQGPFVGSLGSPASLPNVFAIGATDVRDEVAWFSSRGPSPLTNQVKPEVVAPGAAVLSSMPGGGYGLSSGTSMAAPHATGAAALLLSANSALSNNEVRQVLRSTAYSMGSTIPNSDSGYGRLDVSAAVATQKSHGTLTGSVMSAVAGAPDSLATAVITFTNSAGQTFTIQPHGNGSYQVKLKPGIYQLRLTAFGYEPLVINNIVIVANMTRSQNLTLIPLPFAPVTGHVRDEQGYLLEGVTITVRGTPFATTSGPNGQFGLSLPLGIYVLDAAANGYKPTPLYLNVNDPAGHIASFALLVRPTVLLVNDGLWHYQDFSAYYQQSLYDAGYSFDWHIIYDPFNDAPTYERLADYDIVIWASPRYSPEFAHGGNALAEYLEEGGKLLVFGPNVAAYDGTGVTPHVWWYGYLHGRWVERRSPDSPLTGVVGTVFDGLTFTLNGPDTPNNQVETDIVTALTDSFTEPALTFGDGSAAALQSGLCEPHQMMYLGFGLEGVSPAAARPQLIQRTVQWLQAPTTTVGIQLAPSQIDTLALPGTTYLYTVTLNNISEVMTDTFTLSLSGNHWAATLISPTVTVGPCTSAKTVVRLVVPPDLPANTHHNMTVRATSSNDGTVHDQVAFHHKTPGNILFVDDDRFYDLEDTLLDALTANGLVYDVWETDWNLPVSNSPPTTLLPYYDMVIWYTGFDWYAPLTAAEVNALQHYLAQGGRLLLTSQDYLYYHHDNALTQDYFGVRDYYGESAPTLVMPDGSWHQAGLTQPIPLHVTPYQNFADSLIMGSGEPWLWQDTGLPGAAANWGWASNGRQWRTLFLAFPLEKLPAEVQNEAMNGMIGWLSDLGDSTFVVDEIYSPSGGANRVFTITLRNTGAVNHLVTVVNTLPNQLQINTSTITGGASYNQTTRQLHWQGVIPPDGVHEIRYTAAASPDLPPGSRLDNQLDIRYYRHNFTRHQTVSVWVGVPDLRSSAISVTPATLTRNQPITYTLTLHNSGNLPAPTVSTTLFLPLPLYPITDTLVSSSGEVTMTHRAVSWQGAIQPGETVTVSLVLTATNGAETVWLGAAAIINDGFTDPILTHHLTPLFAPYQFFLPRLIRPDS